MVRVSKGPDGVASAGKRKLELVFWKYAALGTWAVLAISMVGVLYVNGPSNVVGLPAGLHSSSTKEFTRTVGKLKRSDDDVPPLGKVVRSSAAKDDQTPDKVTKKKKDETLRCKEGDEHGDYVGPCNFPYPKRTAPDEGWLDAIDFYFLRDSHDDREKCFLQCIDELSPSDFADEMLIQATIKGLTKVATRLYTVHGLDPLYRPPRSGGLVEGRGFNAIQEAIHGGYAEIVKVLTNSNNDMVIDGYGRTVRDYVILKGSPILPAYAKSILGVDVKAEAAATSPRKVESARKVADSSIPTARGWDLHSASDYEDMCDIDVIYDDMTRDVFIKEYMSTGRPVVLRNHVSKEEIKAFSKSRWDSTDRFNMHKIFSVGPTAYPSLTDQERCKKGMTIPQIEADDKCEEMPDLPMVHAHHPNQDDFDDLYPMYGGNPLQKSGGWRKIEEYFGPKKDAVLGWQVFFGGDESGATMHWHNAAFNILYVGVKEWTLSPPVHRGFTGMPSKQLADHLEPSQIYKCIQQPGDQIIVPNYWGHATFNHGFTIGAAVILENERYQKGYVLQKEYEKGKSFKNKEKEEKAKSSQAIKATGKAKSGKQIPFLFIHINKTGGTSLIDLFRNRCPKEYVRESWGKNHRSFHSTAHSYIEHYGRDIFDQAYTFAVVRHPLARQVSNFFFLANRCKEYPRECEPRLIPSDIDIDSMSDAEKIEAFDAWILRLYKAHPPGSANHHLFASLGHGNEEFETFGSTQTSWLVDSDGEIVVKDIFKLEELGEDMTPLAEAIPCLSAGEAKGKKMKMIKKNATKSYPDYMLFAKNAKTKKMIKEVFADDFKNFGYKL